MVAHGVAEGQQQDDGVGEDLTGGDGLSWVHGRHSVWDQFCVHFRWNYHSIWGFPGQSPKSSQEKSGKMRQNGQCFPVENKCACVGGGVGKR